MENLFAQTIEKVEKEIKKAQSEAQNLKIDLLKHYLLNFILFENLTETEKEDTPILEKLTSITVLLSKMLQIEDKTNAVNLKRVADKRMLKNRGETKKSRNRLPPQEKYKRNAGRLLERTKPKDDFNIDVKKSKSNKFN